MLGFSDLSNVLGKEGLQLVAAEGDEKKDAPKDKKKEKDAPAPDAGLDALAPEGFGENLPMIPSGPMLSLGFQGVCSALCEEERRTRKEVYGRANLCSRLRLGSPLCQGSRGGGIRHDRPADYSTHFPDGA